MDIKNCPFCGGRGHVDMSHGSNKPYISKNKELKSTINLYHVFCGNCLAKSMDYEKIDDAIIAWNRRRGEPFSCDREKCKGCEQFGWVCDFENKIHGYFTCRLQNKKCADTHITAEFITPQHFSESQIMLYDD